MVRVALIFPTIYGLSSVLYIYKKKTRYDISFYNSHQISLREGSIWGKITRWDWGGPGLCAKCSARPERGGGGSRLRAEHGDGAGVLHLLLKGREQERRKKGGGGEVERG